ncbi:MAG TPA: FAD-dependent oxidoreductase, partial [Rhodocyclaceae bacterium]|nr:FAD-dependent oxidoreductase [Rhodocyclaceae bacterium]
MSQIIEVKVPDIGDFDTVPVIEVFVKAGDTIKVEDPIVTLESDKATMDVPSSAAGVVKEVLVKLGDKVGEGAVLIRLEAAASPSPSPLAGEGRGEGAKATTAVAQPPSPPTPLPPGERGAYGGAVDIECDMVVLGAGPGGYSAAFRSADLGMKTVIVERYSTLGGVCLNVGCIPSKALLHVAAVMEEAQHLGDTGITFAAPKVDLDQLRGYKEKVVSKLTGGLAG